MVEAVGKTYRSDFRCYPVNIVLDTDVPIFNYPDYIEGEYIWSYLSRLAFDNGYPDVMDFLNRISLGKAEWRNYMKWSYDVDRPIVSNLIAIGEPGAFIKKSTLITSLQLFWSRWTQANKVYSYAAEYERDSSMKIFSRPFSDVEHLRVCPVCMEEDMENGWFHYHKVHQMPGVSICPIHGCHLLQYVGIPGHEISNFEFEKQSSVEMDFKYACFCKALVDNEPVGSLYDTVYALRERLNELYPGLYFDALEKVAREDYRFQKYPEVLELLSKIINSKTLHSLPVEHTIRLLIILFGSYDNFMRYLPVAHSLRCRFESAIVNEYELMSPYSDSFIAVRCCDCGHVFLTTPMAMIARLGCPSCNERISEESIFRRMLDSVDGGAWTIKTSFKAIGLKTNFVNEKTGESRFCSASSLIFDDRKVCWNIIKGEEQSNRIRENYYSRVMAEISNGRFSVEEQDDPHRFIATDGNKIIQDVGFTQLCNRVKVYVSRSSIDQLRKECIHKMKLAVAANDHHILFPDDYAPIPELLPCIRRRFSKLKEDGKVERFCKNIYFHAGDRHSIDEIIYTRFFFRYGKYVGIPICDSLFSYLDSGLVYCSQPAFAFCSKEKKVDKAVLRIGKIGVSVYYMADEITEDNWQKLSAKFTLCSDSYIRKLDKGSLEKLSRFCIDVGLTMNDFGTFYEEHPRYARELVESVIKGDLNGNFSN